MVYREISETEKNKPRGRPFTKGNKRGKNEDTVLVDSRPSVSYKGGVITSSQKQSSVEPIKAEISQNLEVIDDNETENVEDENKTVDSLEFKNGNNTLSIRFSSVNNRRYRIQVFLNDQLEVRPVTYQGSSSGNAFWKLLKGALKK